MQDDQKQPLPICANDTVTVPLWLHTAAFLGFSREVIKLKKTIYENAKKKTLQQNFAKHCVWNVPFLPRPGTTFTLYGE